MSTAKIHSIREVAEADRVHPGIMHQEVQDKRDKIRERLTAINAVRLRNTDERAELLQRLEALDASDEAITTERSELVIMDRGLAAYAMELDCLITERAGQ